VSIIVTPDVGAGHVSGWSGAGDVLSAGQSFTVSNMQSGTYSISLQYVPTNGIIASANVQVSGGTGLNLAVGQYVNYTLQATVHTSSGDQSMTGYIRYTVIAVTSSNVTYNMTESQSLNGGAPWVSYNEETSSLTVMFGGADLNNITGTGSGASYVGPDSISTNWGLKNCDKYTATISNGGQGMSYTIWVYHSVILKASVTITTTDGSMQESETLASTNLTAVTS
jgi:hypothetical protein